MEYSKLNTGRGRSLNILSEGSGDMRTLQSRDIYCREVAWTVQLSTISLQSGELFREFKCCAALSSIQGLIWVRRGHQVLNTCLILSM